MPSSSFNGNVVRSRCRKPFFPLRANFVPSSDVKPAIGEKLKARNSTCSKELYLLSPFLLHFPSRNFPLEHETREREREREKVFVMASVTLKKNYRCVPSLQQFYTGGPFAVSSDGSFLVCTCNESIKVVDSSNASIRSTIEGNSEAITALALSPDNKLLFSSSHSRQIRVWELSSLKCLRSWKGHEGPVMGMACDASGGLLATAGADRKVLVWDVDGGFCTHYFKGHKGVLTTILFHPDPNCLLIRILLPVR